MNAATSLAAKAEFNVNPAASITAPQRGNKFEIGTGFTAASFRERDFAGAMDPLVMVDHYRMTEPTFGAHPHAGLSAVSILFEDSEGEFHNRDSLSNDFDLMPGDLYWLKAGSGVVHDEAPRAGANIHGLQVFVNLPATMKRTTPESLRVKAQNMPLLKTDNYRVRVVLGESNGITGESSPALPMTILDGKIAAGSGFAHTLQTGENAWVYAINGALEVNMAGDQVKLLPGQSIAIESQSESEPHAIELINASDSRSHFALLAGRPVREAFIQKGPFVMSTEAEIEQLEADFAAGGLGRLD